MKFKVFAATVVASATAFAALPAAAQTLSPTYYGNLGYSYVDGGDGAQFSAIHARLGARLHRYFGLEAEGGLGVDGDKTSVSGVSVSTKLKHSVGAYAVAFLPVTPQFDLFVRGGYGGSRVKASAAGVSASDSEDSWNYGGGGQYFFDAKNGLRAEYTRHDFGAGSGDADVWAISYVRKF